jgi:uncharacterized protein YfdQ (DUF2303 family)
VFEKYSQFVFDDPSIDLYSESIRMFEGFTDANGNARIVFNPGTISAPGMLNVLFTVKSAERVEMKV